MKLLIDTAPFLWILAGDDLSPNARAALEHIDSELYLSSASVWEIALKHALGKLPLPRPPVQFVASQRERRGIDSLPIDEAAALRAGTLPAIHRDPFDRIIVAQAIESSMTIVTPDPLVQAYPVRTLW